MKKIILLFSIVFISFVSFSQIIIEENFDTYSDGDKVAQTIGNPWSTWSGTVGAGEDMTVSTANASSPSNSVLIADNNDGILLLNDLTTGRYTLEFKTLIASGKIGYFNLLQDFAEANSKWGFQVYFNPSGAGLVDAGGAGAGSFTYAYDTWIPVVVIVDLDDDFATLYVDGNNIVSWIWSKGSFGDGNLNKLDAANFYGTTTGGSSEMYIDDLVFTKVTAPNTPINLTSVMSGSDVDVSWTAPTPTPDSYIIYNNTGILAGDVTVTNYLHVTPINGDHTYTARAEYNGLGYSTLSNESTINVDILGNGFARVVMIEQYTTEQCPNCPPVLATLEDVVDNDDNIICVTHHAGYYTDFLTIPLHSDMLDFYNDGGSTSAPAGMVDRHYNGIDNDGDGTIEPGPVFWDGNIALNTKINERKSVATFLTVDICGAYNLSTRELTATVSGNLFNDYTDLGTVLFVTEDHIAQVNQQGLSAGSTFEHRFTSRAVVSDRLGDAISTSTNNGDVYSKEYTYTMDAAWSYDNLFLVASTQHMSASDINDRASYNAVQIKLSDLAACASSVSELENNDINIYPNPTTGILNIKTENSSSIEIINSIGQIVVTIENPSNMETVNISNLENGTYIVKIIFDNEIAIKKVNLMK